VYEGAGFEMVGLPTAGRTFSGSHRVRLGDCSPGGRLRLDAAARYLQDLSDDDTRDAGLTQMTWVVRRAVIDVLQFPTYLEPLDMVTWCSGLGSRWAERRVDLHSASGGSLSSATLWVHLHGETLRPIAPGADFREVFAPSTQGRTISSRLTVAGPPPGLDVVPWTARFADFDVMNHMNNAIAFVIVEEMLARRRDLRAPLRVEVEYRSSVDPDVVLRVGGIDCIDGAGGPDGHEGWLVDDQARCLIAFRVSRPPVPSA
jgi:acyl-ACP thioesterase